MELLRGLTAARVLSYQEGTDSTEMFKITPEMSHILADESSLMFNAGAFNGGVDPVLADLIVEAFHTGIGYTYQSVGQRLGEESVTQMKRMLGVWTRLALVDQVIAAMDGGQVIAKLRGGGGAILDMGCGSGVAANCMAAAFPASIVHAVDPDGVALSVARKDAQLQGSQNVQFFEALGEDFDTPVQYDLAVCLDIIHDAPRPDLILERLKLLLKPGGATSYTSCFDQSHACCVGTLLIKDIKSLGTFPKNLAKIKTLAMTYGFSLSMCLSSSMSQADGMGLGTLGFNPIVAREMCSQAGFTRFVQHDFKDPANLYYEMRAPGGALRVSNAAAEVDLSSMPGPAFCSCHGNLDIAMNACASKTSRL